MENPSSSSANNRPQRLSRGNESSSGIAAPHPISNLLSAEQRNEFDHGARVRRTEIPQNPPGVVPLKPGAPQFSIAGVRGADLHSERKQPLPGRGTTQRGMEDTTQRAQPPRDVQDAARERGHTMQVIFHNHGEVFLPPPAWGSAAWAEPLGQSPPRTGCSSWGEVRVPSPFQQSAADGARYVLRATTTHGDSRHWSQQRLPSGGQPRSAKVGALREQLIGFAKPAHPPPAATGV